MSVALNGSRLTPQSPAGWAWPIEPMTGVTAMAHARTNRRHRISGDLSRSPRPKPVVFADRPRLGADSREQRSEVPASHLEAEIAQQTCMAARHGHEPHTEP